jgi:hypothetical protein
VDSGNDNLPEAARYAALAADAFSSADMAKHPVARRILRDIALSYLRLAMTCHRDDAHKANVLRFRRAGT